MKNVFPPLTKAERFEGCILGGAIGDAWGSGFENQFELEEDTYYLVGHPEVRMPEWGITDDTQLTLATIEAFSSKSKVEPESIAMRFLQYFKTRKLRGLGASTIKALQDLNAGGHWSQVGRKGEYAAGNGAAMRIAPLAFIDELTDSEIRDICRITHHNDEAYIGAKSVIIAIRSAIGGIWKGDSDLLELIIDQIPDTRVRDRLIDIKEMESLKEISQLGKDGYVVNSVPLAIAAANKVKNIGMEEMYAQLIEIGGDTDTNCSIAGHIAGALVGSTGIPQPLLNKLKEIRDYQWIKSTINDFIKTQNWSH